MKWILYILCFFFISCKTTRHIERTVQDTHVNTSLSIDSSRVKSIDSSSVKKEATVISKSDSGTITEIVEEEIVEKKEIPRDTTKPIIETKTTKRKIVKNTQKKENETINKTFSDSSRFKENDSIHNSIIAKSDSIFHSEKTVKDIVKKSITKWWIWVLAGLLASGFIVYKYKLPIGKFISRFKTNKDENT